MLLASTTALAVLFYIVSLSCGIKLTLKAAKARPEIKERSTNESRECKFTIVVPALREQSVIVSTVDHLLRMRYRDGLFRIVVACHHSESGPNSTAALVRQHFGHKANGVPSVTVFEYPGNKTKRSAQINYALLGIDAPQLEDGQRHIISVFDADSMPDLESLSDVNRLFTTFDGVQAVQQASIYLLNTDELKRQPFLLANAIIQTLWCYSFELPLLIRASQAAARGKEIAFPPYGLGHGMHIDLRTLKRIGGFPEDGNCDGIQLGFLLASEGTPLFPSFVPDHCQSPSSLAVVFHQHSFWFSGNLEFFKLWKRGRIKTKSAAILNHVLLNVRWLLLPALAILPALALGWAYLVIVYAVFWAYYAFSFRTVRRASHGSIPEATFAALALLPAAAAFKSLGAMFGLITIMKGDTTYRKVER